MFVHSVNRRTAEASSLAMLILAVLAIALVAISAESDADTSYEVSDGTLIITGGSEKAVIESEAVSGFKDQVTEVVAIGNFDIGESAFQDWTGLKIFAMDAEKYEVDVASLAFAGCTMDYLAISCVKIGIQNDAFEGSDIAYFVECGDSKNVTDLDQQLYGNPGPVVIERGSITAMATTIYHHLILVPNDLALGDVSRHVVVTEQGYTYTIEGNAVSAYDSLADEDVTITPAEKEGAQFTEWTAEYNDHFQLCYTLTANFAADSEDCTVTVQSSNDAFGHVTVTEITVPSGTEYSVSGNVLTVGNYASEAVDNSKSKLVFEFVGWSVDSGTVDSDMTVIASFRVTSFVYDNTVYSVNPQDNSLMVTEIVMEAHSINIPDTVTYEGVEYTPTSIGAEAFDYHYDDCFYLQHLTIGANVTEIDTKFNCVNLETITVSEDNPAFSSVAGVLYDKDVTKLVRFPECKLRLIIPLTVTEIGEYAFYDAGTNLVLSNIDEHFRYVSIPGSVVTVGESAFENSTLEILKFNDGTTTIGANAFKGCGALSYVVFCDSIEFIGIDAFEGISFFDQAGDEMAIGDASKGYKFIGSGSVLDMYVPDPGASIHDGTYVYRVTASEDEKKVAVLGFEDGVSMESVVIEKSVRYLGFDWEIERIASKAFMGDTGIKSVNIWCDVGFKSFARCTSITSASLSGTSVGDYAFFGCISLEAVDVGDSIVDVGASAFSGCSSLCTFDMQFLTDIGKHAFYGCAFTKADLSCAEIVGLGAFTGNDLQTVIFGQDLSEIDSKAFFRYTFKDASGEKIGITVDDLLGKTFIGSDKVLTQAA